MGEKWPVNFACDSDFHVNPGHVKYIERELQVVHVPKIFHAAVGKAVFLNTSRTPIAQLRKRGQNKQTDCTRNI